MPRLHFLAVPPLVCSCLPSLKLIWRMDAMTLHLPEFIDENVDYMSDPLMILLMAFGIVQSAHVHRPRG